VHLGLGIAARCGDAVKIPGVLPIKAGIRTLRPISRKSPYSDEDSAKKNYRNLAKLFLFSACRTKWPPIGGSSRSGSLGAVSECHHVAFQRGRRHEEEDDSYHADGACGSYAASLEVLAVRSEADARSRMRKRRGTERPGQRKNMPSFRASDRKPQEA
jgi:hypothetical protein